MMPINYFYDVLALSLDINHGKVNHNRKFYYDRISNSFEPIYYDGNSQILDREKDLEEFSFKDYVDYEYMSLAAKELLNMINKGLLNTKYLCRNEIKGRKF